MSGRLVDLFRALKAGSKNGSVFGLRSFAKSFKSAAVKAGLKGLTIHALRHTAASRMVEAGVDLMSVSQLLGHSDLKITMRYLHPRAESRSGRPSRSSRRPSGRLVSGKENAENGTEANAGTKAVPAAEHSAYN